MAKQQKRSTITPSEGLPVATRQNSSTAFDPDYTYVIQNLKKIGALAICFIAILIILSFIL